MDDTKIQTEGEEVNVEAVSAAAPAAAAVAPSQGGERRGSRGPRRGTRTQRPERKSEFDQKILTIRRVARTVAGGRRFAFSVAIVIGNKKGRVGVGTGKAGDTSLAIDKAVRDAKKNMITLKLTKEGSIAHDVSAKYSSSRVDIIPSPGRGLVAGSSVRSVLELGGVTNIVAKLHSGTKNRLNNAQAAVKALQSLKA